MADGHDVARTDEHMRFAKGDAAVDQLRRAGHDEQRFAVLLELGALMRLLRVFDGKVMQIELLLDLVQEFVAGFEQADPDDMAGL